MRQPAPGQFSLASWSTNGLQPSFDTIQARAYASGLELVEPLTSPFVRLRLGCCSWQNSRREILRAKSPGPASIVKVEAAGDGGTTLTSADGPYHDAPFRAKISPISNLFPLPPKSRRYRCQWSSEMVAASTGPRPRGRGMFGRT